MSRTIGKYELLRELGAGGMAVVYEARDTMLDRRVALKVINQRLQGHEEAQKRFLREARAAAALNHPNIVTIYELGLEDGFPYIAMEYMPGRDLYELIRQKEPLALFQKVTILLQVARALQHAHANKVLHRDVKPHNIRVLTKGTVKLMDFGIARLLTTEDASGLTATGMVPGTPSYLSPEQIQGEPATAASDVFSFGVVLYELLSYKRPFEAPQRDAIYYRILHAEPPPIEGGMPPELEGLLKACLMKAPEQRLRSFEPVVRLLSELRQRLRAERSIQPGLDLEPKTPVLPVVAAAPEAPQPEMVEPPGQTPATIGLVEPPGQTPASPGTDEPTGPASEQPDPKTDPTRRASPRASSRRLPGPGRSARQPGAGVGVLRLLGPAAAIALILTAGLGMLSVAPKWLGIGVDGAGSTGLASPTPVEARPQEDPPGLVPDTTSGTNLGSSPSPGSASAARTVRVLPTTPAAAPQARASSTLGPSILALQTATGPPAPPRTRTTAPLPATFTRTPTAPPTFTPVPPTAVPTLTWTPSLPPTPVPPPPTRLPSPRPDRTPTLVPPPASRAPSPRPSQTPTLRPTRPLQPTAPPTQAVQPTDPPPVPTATTRPPTPATAPVGTLVLVTQPWAYFSIDGGPDRQTPHPQIELPAGTHRLSIRREGFEPVENIFSLASGEELPLRFVLNPLQPDTGQFRLVARPWAFFRIDGGEQLQTPHPDLSISAGAHTMIVYREGFKTVRQGFFITADQLLKLQIDLEKAP